MEVCPQGDLLKHMNEVGALKDEAAKDVFGQILKGVQFCHSLGVMHRDLKMENVCRACMP